MAAGHGDTADQKRTAVVAWEHRTSRQHQLLQPWLVLTFPAWAALPWAAGLSSSSEALRAKPNAQGDKCTSLVLGYFLPISENYSTTDGFSGQKGPP